MTVAAVVPVLGVYALHRYAAVHPHALHVLPFDSGWVPEQHALSRYHVRWYLATLLFLAFDVEMLFEVPPGP
ncbi:NADH-quinone oxidoreductase subunit A [Nocardioides sp. SOB77]|uniref:NADH-quinone oxidoreductase subunit n=1 Tax=Nocardioides oceani TaxID=3058369 RepID=A0ABT8FMW4_9ACTN|nr:NADH-quinone oxidoreductase subunit A [Nocardioides oceani]MDN4175865.1 NADH-quinone oxidoreductase subunit A [Nocardioides oceani]